MIRRRTATRCFRLLRAQASPISTLPPSTRLKTATDASRALAEKALSQVLGQPTLIALSQTIQKNKTSYYEALHQSSRDNEITGWLGYFAETVLQAQDTTQSMIDFLIQKTKLYDRAKSQLNERQAKALARIFREGVEGFKGGLSAENYISGSSPWRVGKFSVILDRRQPASEDL